VRTPSNYWQSSDKRQINQKTSVEEAEKRQNERIAPLHNQNTTNDSTPNTSSYGTCWKCSNAIAIPGLTANYCPTCGWIVNRSKQQKGLGQ